MLGGGSESRGIKENWGLGRLLERDFVLHSKKLRGKKILLKFRNRF